MDVAAIVDQIMPKIVQVESAGNAKAVSKKGAMGLAQIMPGTWKEWAPKVIKNEKPDPYNKDHNLKVATAYMNWLMPQFDNNIGLALAAYNYGPGNVKRLLEGKAKGLGEIFDQLPEETQNYVQKILI